MHTINLYLRFFYAYILSLVQVRHRIRLACSSHQESATAWPNNPLTVQCNQKLLPPQALGCTPLDHTNLAHHRLLTCHLQAHRCKAGVGWEVHYPIPLLNLPALAQALATGCPWHSQHCPLLPCLPVATTQTHRHRLGSTTRPHLHQILWAHLHVVLWVIMWPHQQVHRCHHHHHRQLTAPYRLPTCPTCPIVPHSPQAPGCPPPLGIHSSTKVTTQAHSATQMMKLVKLCELHWSLFFKN